MSDLPFAEDVSYWKSSKSGVESWLDKVEKLIVNNDGKVHTRIVGRAHGDEAIMFGFTLANDNYKMVWPILPTKKEEDRPAAMRQCATLIYHDTKARINRLKIFPPRTVFADYFVLPSGKTLAESGVSNITDNLLKLSK